MRIHTLVVSFAVTVLASAGCAAQGHRSLDGVNGDDAGAGADDGGGAVTAPSAIGVSLFGAACDGGTAVDWSPVRRISRVEYDAMVRDLLGDTTSPATGFVAESPLGDGVNFQANTYTGVGASDTIVPEQYLQAAETLAAAAVADPNTLANVLALSGVNSSCAAQDDACAQAFITAFATSAFRGQIDAGEGAQLFQDVYTPIRTQFDFATGVQAVITAVLTSPRFLYVLEFGQPGGSGQTTIVPLGPNEIATRLALFLWRSIPDRTLLQAAAAGQLSTADEIEQQAVRMLADPKAMSALDDFAAQWMEIANAGTMARDQQYKTWTNYPALAKELVGETLANYHFTVANGGSLTDLLSSSESYVNADLTAYYAGGASVVITGQNADPTNPADYKKTTVGTSTNPRAGILTNAIVLAAQSHTSFPSPTLRGKLVREQVLCDPIQPPPAGLMIGPPPSTVPNTATVKDQYAAHTVPGSVCANCHHLMDAIGDGFGVYDATGAYQTTEIDGRDAGGGPYPAIDPSGQIATYQVIDTKGNVVETATSELSTTFTGPVDLANQLAGATQVRECFVLQELRYALGRIETPADACSAQQIYGAFSSSSFGLQAVIRAIVRSDAFRFRTVVTPGSACQ
jgi:hypothetical protein